MNDKLDSAIEPPFEAAVQPIVVNHTPWPSQYFQHIDPAGELYHVMVSRLTYSLRGMNFSQKELPVPTLLPLEQQTELVEEDRYTGSINGSSLIEESDYAPFKPKCDVILANAVAHSPTGKPMDRWAVGFRFGDAIEKRIQVVGPRHFERSIVTLGTNRLSAPTPCLRVPIAYELAYGGPNTVDAHLHAQANGDSLPDFFEINPIGTGRYGKKRDRDWIENESQRIETAHRKSDRTVLAPRASLSFTEEGRYRGPQIEAFDDAFDERCDYPVVGFGAIARWWMPRRALAGTHDEQWRAQQWPKSPTDHDYGYWNCAPEDQQIDYPRGGEAIVLVNLTPAAASNGEAVRFALPRQSMRLLVRLNSGAMHFVPMNIDTIIVDFAKTTLSIVRRALVSAESDVRKLELGTWGDEENLPTLNAVAPASVVSTRPR
jgi:hypothetical protein